jgi:hypothetical protein
MGGMVQKVGACSASADLSPFLLHLTYPDPSDFAGTLLLFPHPRRSGLAVGPESLPAVVHTLLKEETPC